MTIVSKAPCRVDLAGGTLDIWPLYLFHAQPVTVNFAVNLYAGCSVTLREDTRIVLESIDLKTREEFADIDELRAARRVKLPLLARALEFFAPLNGPLTGIEIETTSDAPAGAGISGSSALLIALCSALNKLTGSGYKLEKIREIAQNIEARVIRVPTGSQDYYPAIYGGVSSIELRADGIHRQSIPVNTAELNARFLLAYTGEPRNSGINNWEVMKAHIDGDRSVHRNFDLIAAIANQMRCALLKRDWDEAGRLLREEWSHRRRNAPGITTPLIDRLIAVTSRAGSTGAKVCGAGGGGCVLFLVEPDARDRVSQLIREEGATVLPARVASRGVKVS
jgi:D-glycero-alpha-D-manno-heptose-7-phosphate kinase